jgi:uncharacterized protein YbjQ (UPF0145 family)
LLVEEVGFEPVEFVLGTTYFHTGWAPSVWSQNMELGNASEMMRTARIVAMDRMRSHAEALGADGIVGMRLEIEREGYNAEFTAYGTAVRRRDGHGRAWRDRQGRAFTCDLSGEDFWAIVRGGFRPVALCHGVCVYHVAYGSLAEYYGGVDVVAMASPNHEHAEFTQALYDARELAMERMQADARSAGGTGLVGVEVRQSNHGWEGHIMEFVSVGTAIVPIEDASHEVHERPQLVMFAADDAPLAPSS